MVLTHPHSGQPALRHRYLRPPRPLFFPVAENVGEGIMGFEIRSILYEIVRLAFGESALVSSDQFLYWDPTNPKRCLAPDLGVRVGTPNEVLSTWKTWERGAPQVGVEIVSPSDARELPWSQKFERYRQAGIAEVVRFSVLRDTPELTLWDLVDGDLVERDLADPEAFFSDALGYYWAIVPDKRRKALLRLARDREGKDLLPTPAEHAAREAEHAAREAEHAAREAEHAARARIAELEAELARRPGR
jgi:hypothetical protein